MSFSSTSNKNFLLEVKGISGQQTHCTNLFDPYKKTTIILILQMRSLRHSEKLSIFPKITLFLTWQIHDFNADSLTPIPMLFTTMLLCPVDK